MNVMKIMKTLKKIFTDIYYKYPSLRPLLLSVNDRLFFKPKFSGMAMKTLATLPWENDENQKTFLSSNEYIKKRFRSYKDNHRIDVNTVKALMWRNWIVSYAVRHAMEFTNEDEVNFAECGVGDGISAFIALNEIINNKKIDKSFRFHLYDSWGAMREKELLPKEYSRIGKYENLDIEITKHNLEKFKEYLVFHQGYVPDSFYDSSKSPRSIIFLHIDLNAANPTKSTLDFFFPKLI